MSQAEAQGLVDHQQDGETLAQTEPAGVGAQARRPLEVAGQPLPYLVLTTIFAALDLNLDTRGLRSQHLARLRVAPEVAVLGASHWQEAHADLLPGRRFYN